MKMQTLTTSSASPVWAGSYKDRSTLLSGGVKVDTSLFTADGTGRKFIPSGTLLGKKVSEAFYGPAAADDDQFGFLWLDIYDAAVNNDAELYVSGEVRLNRLPVAITALIRAPINQKYVFTEGGA